MTTENPCGNDTLDDAELENFRLARTLRACRDMRNVPSSVTTEECRKAIQRGYLFYNTLRAGGGRWMLTPEGHEFLLKN